MKINILSVATKFSWLHQLVRSVEKSHWLIAVKSHTAKDAYPDMLTWHETTELGYLLVLLCFMPVCIKRCKLLEWIMIMPRLIFLFLYSV